METKLFYLVENGKQSGPFTFEDLMSKNIEPEFLIWFVGQEKWKKAKDIPELSSLLNRIPPPISNVDDGNSELNIPPLPDNSELILTNYELASVGQRLGGYLLTQIITFILFIILGGKYSDLTISYGFWLDMLYAGVGTGIINGVFYPFFSGNLGHKMLGIRVIRKSDCTPEKNLLSGYMREFFKGALSIIVVPVIWLLFDNEKQNIYDKLQNTLVVKDKDY